MSNYSLVFSLIIGNKDPQPLRKQKNTSVICSTSLICFSMLKSYIYSLSLFLLLLLLPSIPIFAPVPENKQGATVFMWVIALGYADTENNKYFSFCH